MTAFSKPSVFVSDVSPVISVSKSYTYSSAPGFTLLELLVVITLLGIISSAVVLGYEGVQDQGREDAARFEIAEIRKALLQFRRDSGTKKFPAHGSYDCTDNANGNPSNVNPDMSFPAEAGSTDAAIIAWCQSPANFWMLFNDPLGDGWNPDTKRGWNGPYLRSRQTAVNYLAVNSLWGVTDPNGNPYLLQDLGNAYDARLVSMGADGVYGDKNGTNPCLANDADDYVLCLLR